MDVCTGQSLVRRGYSLLEQVHTRQPLRRDTGLGERAQPPA
ncbi:MAG TPA: hypothetical protein VID70_01450 [Solirubrobacteraceae bacterium]